jgi:hypothetical protein
MGGRAPSCASAYASPVTLPWLPPGAELETDLAPASWIVERLRPWDRDGVRVWSFLPDTFEAYARSIRPVRRARGPLFRGAGARWPAVAAFRWDEELERTPRVRVPNRSYFLIRGSLVSACAFPVGGAGLTPNLWHPDDRAWCVATEIDGYSTYVAGSRDTIDDVLDAPDLEAVEVRPETHLDVGPLLPRWRPRFPEHRPG